MIRQVEINDGQIGFVGCSIDHATVRYNAPDHFMPFGKECGAQKVAYVGFVFDGQNGGATGGGTSVGLRLRRRWSVRQGQ